MSIFTDPHALGWLAFCVGVSFAYYALKLLGVIADELVALRKATEARR